MKTINYLCFIIFLVLSCESQTVLFEIKDSSYPINDFLYMAEDVNLELLTNSMYLTEKENGVASENIQFKYLGEIYRDSNFSSHIIFGDEFSSNGRIYSFLIRNLNLDNEIIDTHKFAEWNDSLNIYYFGRILLKDKIVIESYRNDIKGIARAIVNEEGNIDMNYRSSLLLKQREPDDFVVSYREVEYDSLSYKILKRYSQYDNSRMLEVFHDTTYMTINYIEYYPTGRIKSNITRTEDGDKIGDWVYYSTAGTIDSSKTYEPSQSLSYFEFVDIVDDQNLLSSGRFNISYNESHLRWELLVWEVSDESENMYVGIGYYFNPDVDSLEKIDSTIFAIRCLDSETEFN